jgi:hypothetical protein
LPQAQLGLWFYCFKINNLKFNTPMKKIFLMLAVVGTLTFGACSADKETQAKQEEANKNADKEAGEMPEFDENGNEIKKDEKKDDKAAVQSDTTKKAEEPKVEKP